MIDIKQEMQELLNISVAHIRRQGGPSFVKSSQGTQCLYRGPDSTSCAAAPFITNYLPEMEGKGFHRVALEHPYCVDEKAKRHRRFVLELQAAHDGAVCGFSHSFLEHYEHGIKRIANKFGLTVPPTEHVQA